MDYHVMTESALRASRCCPGTQADVPRGTIDYAWDARICSRTQFKPRAQPKQQQPENKPNTTR